MTSKLFATHPAIEERIANLRALEQTGPLNEST
jgi:Zn-dependent protease with chaperone function